MKNREVRVLIATMMLVSMVAGSIFTSGATVMAGENAAAQTSVSAEIEKSAVPKKDETVYAKIDGSGNIKSVTVSDQLKNLSGTTALKDVSILNEIENVKGDETFTGNAGSMVWNTADADICYQGTTDKALPVGVKISYQLDGKDISEDELKGKSGRMTVRYTYVNQSADVDADKTPFLMATGLLLDSDHFKNVTVTNGRLVSDGERDVAVGYGFPGLKEMLGVEEIEIPDYFEVEADVTDYEVIESIMVASNSVFNELDVDGIDSLSDLEASMYKLQDASNQLVEGSGELKDGLDSLLNASGTLTDGIDQLANGGDTLLAGTQTLTDGSSQLAAGNAALSEGTGLLKSGADTLKEGAGQLNAGLLSASEQTQNVLLPGVQTLDAGVGQIQDSLGEQLPVLQSGVSSLNSGVAQAGDGIAALDSGLSQAATGAAGLNEGMQTLAGQTPGLSQAAAALSQGLQAAAGAGKTAAEQPDSYTEIDTIRTLAAQVTDPDLQAQLNAVAESLAAEQAARETNAAAGTDLTVLVGLAQQVAGGAEAVNAGVQSAAQGATSLNDGVQAAASGAAALDAAVNTGSADGTPSLREGAASLEQGINGENGLAVQIGAGVSQLKDGTSALAAGVGGENGLAAGLNQLSGGAASLNAGASQLSEKLGEADAGAKTAASGSASLADGAKTLLDGTKTLSTGIHTLKDGSGELIDGVKKLDEGAGQLQDGMIQFDEEGIQKLASVFDGDIEGLVDKVNAVLDKSKAYKNFSGIADGMDGEVKFVFMAE